jgi:hypothetical protein
MLGVAIATSEMAVSSRCIHVAGHSGLVRSRNRGQRTHVERQLGTVQAYAIVDVDRRVTLR